MPKWVRNHVYFDMADEKDVQKLMDYLKSDSCAFDLNRIIPMPKGIAETVGKKYNCDIKYMAEEAVNLMRIIGKTEMTKDIARKTGVHTEQTYQKVKKLVSNKNKHNFFFCEDWCYWHWGTPHNTKSVVFNQISNTRVEYVFETANTYPARIVEALTTLGLNGEVSWVVGNEDDFDENYPAFIRFNLQ